MIDETKPDLIYFWANKIETITEYTFDGRHQLDERVNELLEKIALDPDMMFMGIQYEVSITSVDSDMHAIHSCMIRWEEKMVKPAEKKEENK